MIELTQEQQQELDKFGGIDEAPTEEPAETAAEDHQSAPEETKIEEEGEVEETIIFADEKPQDEPQESSVIREMRRKLREAEKAQRELEAKLAEKSAPATETPKPTLASCNYDEEAYEAALAGWVKEQEAVTAQKAAKAREAEEINRAWEEKRAKYATARTTVKLAGFEDAEAVTMAALNTVQQSILIAAGESPEKLVYALGRSEAKLKELAAIKDPVRFAAAVGRLEGQIKTTTKKLPPPPEKGVPGAQRKPNPADRFDVGGHFE